MIPPRRFPRTRLRRLRLSKAVRALSAEHHLTARDFIYPVFVHDGTQAQEEIPALPAVYRHSQSSVLRVAEQAINAGIEALALFPVIAPEHKTADGREAYNERGLVPQTVRLLKKIFPDLAVITDVALDPYTAHGQDGVIDADGYVLNDATLAVLQRQALCQAAAGADMVAPSDMMDGRIAVLRDALEEQGFVNTIILSYAIKYASHFYQPFRAAVRSAEVLQGDKRNYQMQPANRAEALHEASMDVSEGADILLVKPAGLYLDVVAAVAAACQVPVYAYQVSGEYVMLKSAARFLSEPHCVLEALLAIKRAGASAIFTYYALDAVQWLRAEGLG